MPPAVSTWRAMRLLRGCADRRNGSAAGRRERSLRTRAARACASTPGLGRNRVASCAPGSTGSSPSGGSEPSGCRTPATARRGKLRPARWRAGDAMAREVRVRTSGLIGTRVERARTPLRSGSERVCAGKITLGAARALHGAAHSASGDIAAKTAAGRDVSRCPRGRAVRGGTAGVVAGCTTHQRRHVGWRKEPEKEPGIPW